MAGQYLDWWKKKGRPTGNPSSPPQPSVNIATIPQPSPVTHSSNSGEFYTFMTKIQECTAGIPKVTTYTNSAASEHCFTEVADSVTYELYKGNGKTATKSSQFFILGTGKIIKWVVYNRHIITLSFENTYHCPDLSHNLISIGHLDKAGCYSVSGAGGVTFLNLSGNPFLYGKGIGTMYEVELLSPTRHIVVKPLPALAAGTITAACEARSIVLAFSTHSLNKPTDADTWHQRLAISG